MTSRISRREDATKVALFSPFRLLSDALRSALAKDSRVQVVAHAMSVNEIARACKEDPEIIVVCDGSSSDALRFLEAASRRLSRCRKVVLGLHKTQKYMRLCAGIGVRGLVARDASLENLVFAIQSVRSAGEFVSPSLGADLARRARSAPSTAGSAGLTERERQVTDLVTQRLTNRQIGGRLRLSENTVKVHVRHILAKLDVRKRGDVAAFLSRPQRADAPRAAVRRREINYSTRNDKHRDLRKELGRRD